MWHYLTGRWNAEQAVQVYQGPVWKTLQKHRGKKRSYQIIEDNDPSGYKSKKACTAKADLNIVAQHFLHKKR